MNEWIKRIAKQAGKLAVLLVLTACIALPIINAVVEMAAPTALAQPASGTLSSSTDRRSPSFATVGIQPAKNANGTNLVLWVADKTGTNYWGINPTNANLMLRTGGILRTGVTLTVNYSNGIATAATITGVRTNLYFINGLLVDGP